MRRNVGAVLLAAGLTASFPAMAQKSADTLRITWRDAIPDVLPYYNQLRTGVVLAHQAWDSLVYRDPETFQIKPLLAESFKWADETTLEFVLRKNVTFHNGDKLTADDVVYTVNTILSDKQVSTPSNYSYIDHATKVDDTHVRVELKRVFPAALDYMAMTLYIMPKAYREKVGPLEYSRNPIGSGPYKFTRVNGVTEIDLERYDGYYADSPKGRPPIGKLVIHEVPDSATEMAELLGGRADWIWKFSPDQFDAVGQMPTLQAVRGESMRIQFLGMDAAGRTGADNPLTKQKVREAIFYAIDRTTMARQLMQGGSRALDAPCYPTQFGCDAAAAVHYPYDPAKAKQLLAEAGYPNGFDTELVTPDLPQWAGATQGYLKAVGINAKTSVLQVGAWVQRSLAGQNPLELSSWGSYSVNDVSAILPNFFTFTPGDYVRDPELKKLVEAGGATVDADQRRKSYSAAIKLITEKAYWMPMFTHTVTYGFSKQLNFKPYPDELPRFFLSSWK
ncbi:MAG: ABC transporter substrate-binding protein [Acetobacteraceae bacterium]|jgi:peptide/nickel transport system substrate-binding protein